MSHLYTIICEYAGGTYISQVNASSPENAVWSWLGTRASKKVIPKEPRERIKEGLDDDTPIAIRGCRNVWCFSASSKKGLVLINLIRTSLSQGQPS